jgi:hypothetical protein
MAFTELRSAQKEDRVLAFSADKTYADKLLGLGQALCTGELGPEGLSAPRHADPAQDTEARTEKSPGKQC